MKSHFVKRHETAIDAFVRLSEIGSYAILDELIQDIAVFELVNFKKPFSTAIEIIASKGHFKAIAELQKRKKITSEKSILWGYLLGGHHRQAHELAITSSDKTMVDTLQQYRTAIDAYQADPEKLLYYYDASESNPTIDKKFVKDFFYGLGMGNHRNLFDAFYSESNIELANAIMGAAEASNVELVIYLLKEKDTAHQHIEAAASVAFRSKDQSLLNRLFDEPSLVTKNDLLNMCLSVPERLMYPESINNIYNRFPLPDLLKDELTKNFKQSFASKYLDKPASILIFIDDPSLRTALFKTSVSLGMLDVKDTQFEKEFLFKMELVNKTAHDLHCSVSYVNALYNNALLSHTYKPINHAQLPFNEQALLFAIVADNVIGLERAIEQGADITKVYDFKYCKFALTHFAVRCGAIEVLKHLDQIYHLSLEPISGYPQTNILYMSLLLNNDMRKPILQWLNEGENYKKLNCGVTKGHVLSALGISNSKDKSPDNMGLIRQDYACLSGTHYSDKLENLDIFRTIQHGELKQFPLCVVYSYLIANEHQSVETSRLERSLIDAAKNSSSKIDMTARYPENLALSIVKCKTSIIEDLITRHDPEYCKLLINRHSGPAFNLTDLSPQLSTPGNLDLFKHFIQLYPKQPILLSRKEDDETWNGCLSIRLLPGKSMTQSQKSLNCLKEIWQRNKKLGLNEPINLNTCNKALGENYRLSFALLMYKEIALLEEMFDLNPQVVDLTANGITVKNIDTQFDFNDANLACLLAAHKEPGIRILRKMVKMNPTQGIDLNSKLSKAATQNNATFAYLLAKEQAFDLFEHFLDLNPTQTIELHCIGQNLPKENWGFPGTDRDLLEYVNDADKNILKIFAKALKSPKSPEHRVQANRVLRQILLSNVKAIEANQDSLTALLEYRKLLGAQREYMVIQGREYYVNVFLTSEDGRKLLSEWQIEIQQDILLLLTTEDKKDNTTKDKNDITTKPSQAIDESASEDGISKFLNLCKRNTGNVTEACIKDSGNKKLICLHGNNDVLTELSNFIKTKIKKKTIIKNQKDLPGKVKYMEIEDGENALNTLFTQFAIQIATIITKSVINKAKTPSKTNTVSTPSEPAAPIFEKPYKELSETRQQEWYKVFRSAFFQANIITTCWDNNNKCFNIRINEAVPDVEITVERKTDQPITYVLSKEFFDQEIFSRIEKCLEKSEEKGEIKFSSYKSVIKIYPYSDEPIIVKHVCEQIIKKLQDEQGKSVRLKDAPVDAASAANIGAAIGAAMTSEPSITEKIEAIVITEKSNAEVIDRGLSITDIESMLNPQDEIKTPAQLLQFSLAPTNIELLNAVNKLCETIVGPYFSTTESWNFLTIDKINDGQINLRLDCMMKQTIYGVSTIAIMEACKSAINTIVPDFLSIDVDKKNSSRIKIRFNVTKTAQKNSHIAALLTQVSEQMNTLQQLFAETIVQGEVSNNSHSVETSNTPQEPIPDLIIKQLTDLFAKIANNYIDEDQTWDFLDKKIKLFKRVATFNHNTAHANTFKTIPCIKIYEALQKSINSIKPNCMRIKPNTLDKIIFSIHMENDGVPFIKHVEQLYKPEHLKKMQDKFNEECKSLSKEAAALANINLDESQQKTKTLITEKSLPFEKHPTQQNNPVVEDKDKDHDIAQIATPLQRAAIHYFYLKQFEKGKIDSADDHLTLDNIQFHLLFLVKNLIANYTYLNLNVESANYKKQYQEWKNVRQILAHMGQLKGQFSESEFFSFNPNTRSLISLIMQKYKQLNESIELKNIAEAISFKQSPIYQKLFSHDTEDKTKLPIQRHPEGGKGIMKAIIQRLESIAPMISQLKIPQYLNADEKRRDAIKWRMLEMGDLAKQLRDQEFSFCKHQLKSNLTFATYPQALLQKLKDLTNISIQSQVKSDGSQYELILPYLRILERKGKTAEIETIINSLTRSQKFMLMIEIRNTLAHDPKYIVTVHDKDQDLSDISRTVNSNDIEPIMMVTLNLALLKDLPELNSMCKHNAKNDPNNNNNSNNNSNNSSNRDNSSTIYRGNTSSSSTFQFSGAQQQRAQQTSSAMAHALNPNARPYEPRKKF